MATLEVRSLTKSFGPIRAVEDVSFALEPGEVFGYLGPNGAGKTTTLRCIMGLLTPDRGEVVALGETVRAVRATQHARIGYLPGEFRLWPSYRPGYTLRVLAGLGGGPGTEGRRNELAERLELDLDRPVGVLSKGNRQKVAVLYAFQHQPDLLILDEPTSGLDPLLRQVVLDLVRESARAGATVLFSSHDLTEVSAVCGRAGIIREGRLVEIGPISSITRQGEHRLKVWFVDPALAPTLPNAGLPGVRLIEQQPGVLHVAYSGSCDPVLRWLSQFQVDRVATPQTSLEEAFLQYYRSGEHHTTPSGNRIEEASQTRDLSPGTGKSNSTSPQPLSSEERGESPACSSGLGVQRASPPPRIPFPFGLLGFWARRLLPMWCFIALIIFLMQIAVCAIVHDNENVKAFLTFLDVLPSFIKTALGGETLQVGNLPSLIAIGYQHPLVLFLYLLFAVGAPTMLLTGEVQKGTMELILSRAATKTQVYLGAVFLTLAGMVALVVTMFLGTVVATRHFDFGQTIPLDLFFRIAVNGGLVAGAAGAIALCAAGVFPGRSLAVTATIAVVVLNYFAWIVAQWWPRLGFLKPATLFYYANGLKLSRGWPVGDMSVLLAIIVIAIAVGIFSWRRRDLPL